MRRCGQLTQTARGAVALDRVFGEEWRKLNRETAERDLLHATHFNRPCSRPGCGNLASGTVEIGGVDKSVCRQCGNKVLGL